jgi:ferredoxin-NADP reductase
MSFHSNMFGLLRTHRLIYEARQDADGGVSSFGFRPEAPLTAQAGQHVILSLSSMANKPFSLASAPEEDHVLIGTRLASGSAFKQRMGALRPGDIVTVRGPINKFTLATAGQNVVMLAQGVGITPMRSMLAHIALNNLRIESSLIHVADAGHAYRQDTERWATSSQYLNRRADFESATDAAAQAHADATFYIAGAPQFVSSTAARLRKRGIPGRRIRQDKYLFYKPANGAQESSPAAAPPTPSAGPGIGAA